MPRLPHGPLPGPGGSVCRRGQAGPAGGSSPQRAFLNGKLDLTQAEAVIDLIDAESPSAARQAAGQLTGALSRRIEGIYSALTDTMAHFCAVLDYPDEDLDPFQTEALGRDLQAQASALQALLATGRRGQMLAQGITCALIGRPNAGKSSLLNALGGGMSGPSSPTSPGTTRDTIEVKVELAGRPFRLVDTAGLRDSDDPIEQLGAGPQPARPMAASAPTPATPPRKLRREMPPSFVTFVPMMILLMVRFVLRLRMRSRFPRRALYGVRRGLKPPRRGCFGWRKASWRAPPARVI